MKHNWEYKPFKQLANILYGYPFESNFFNSDSKGKPIIRIRDVKPGFTSTFFNGPYSDQYVIKKGEYLIGMDGEFNIAPWQSEDALLNQRVCRVKSSDDNILLTDFIFYFLGRELKKIEEKTSFVTVKHLSAKVLNSINIPVPPLELQEHIVAELDTINRGITELREQIKDLDNLAQSLFYETFGDPISNPKGWELEKLISIAPIKASKQEPWKENGKYWLLNLDQIESNSGKILDFKFFNLEEIGNSTIIFDTKNVLYSKLRPYLNKVVIPQRTGYCSTELVPFRPLKGVINREYLAYSLRCPEFVKYINEKTGGAKMPRVKMDYLRNLMYPIPPFLLQQQFASQIEAIESMKRELEAQIADAQTLLDSRMDYWFND